MGAHEFYQHTVSSEEWWQEQDGSSTEMVG